ncbi:MAG: hypothetical protein K0U21_06810 [Proteobacteria bacterium]|nr:hypothetical protein [Pseudomonadota bacterium]
MRSSIKKVAKVGTLLASVFVLSACQQARVDHWADLPCQPHGFYVAPKGQTLADVAKVCKVDESLLYKYNGWLTTRQPFKENTVVWLRKNPTLGADEEDVQLGNIETANQPKLSAESLAPLNLPSRSTPTKQGAPRLSAH